MAHRVKAKDFRIDELRIVRTIAETASVSKAAQLLDMPQSNVSRTLTALERRLGLEIFLRSPRTLSLTEFGEQFLRRAAQLLDEHNDLLDMSGTYKQSLNGMVTLGAPIGIHSFLTRYVLPPLLHESPELIVDLVTRNPDEREKKYGAVFDSDCDLLISFFQPQNESLIARPLTRFRVGLFASPDYIARSPLAELAELTQHRCITLRVLGGSRNTWSCYNLQGQLEQVEVNGTSICDNILPAVELAKQGLGIVHAPYYSVASALESGSLLPCIERERCIDMQAYLIYRQRGVLPHRVQVMMGSIMNTIKLHEHRLV
ncbi:D-malate degradation protein R [Serratia quinivorans]|nr:LysR family transcriptional regulator [Serratia quinivorans]CAI0844661.1 D-malate degradation protein R [Serratia quinivorans]CAI1050402.1 D-malate degradation protein R [Serratia quinivorans]CAI1497353.1 D-malate degradation protein R [Serratia quinivorans]CAI1535465.1 D-malate degradation protein R [Serratia quinivorans]CAI2098465.1 D-malate degradation protein R [Serratia quinivorans]